MEYVYILPMVEVLVFNVITLDHCFKRKYSKFKMVAVFFFLLYYVFCPQHFLKEMFLTETVSFRYLDFIHNSLEIFI